MCLANEKVNSFTVNSFSTSSNISPGQASSSPVECNLGKKLLSHLASNSFTFLCFTCLVIQLIWISQSYFGYLTGEQITIEIPSIYRAQALSLCVHYKDVISSPNSTLIKQSDIFTKSLPPHLALKRAEFRLPFSYKLYECFSVQSCQKYFNSSKFTYGSFVCYKFHLREHLIRNVSFQSLSVTPAGSGMIFKLWMAYPLNMTSAFKICTHSPNLYPLSSFNSVKLITRNVNKVTDETTNVNNFYSSQTRLTVRRLKKPYESNCFNYTQIGLNSRTECLQRCINRSVSERVKKLPFSVLFNESVDLPLITYDDLINEDKVSMDILKNLKRKCSESSACRQKACESRTAFTLTDAETGPGFDFIIEFIIPHRPNIWVQLYPILHLAEYLTYVMGAIATWIGLTVVDLNPVLLTRKVQVTLHSIKGHFNLQTAGEGKSKFEANRSGVNSSGSSCSFDESDFDLNLHLLSKENLHKMSKEEEQVIQAIHFINSRIKRLENKYWKRKSQSISRIIRLRSDF